MAPSPRLATAAQPFRVGEARRARRPGGAGHLRSAAGTGTRGDWERRRGARPSRGTHLDLQWHEAHFAALAHREALGQVHVLAPLLREELHDEFAVHVDLVAVQAEELLNEQLVARAVRHGRGPREDREAEEHGDRARRRRRAPAAAAGERRDRRLRRRHVPPSVCELRGRGGAHTAARRAPPPRAARRPPPAARSLGRRRGGSRRSPPARPPPPGPRAGRHGGLGGGAGKRARASACARRPDRPLQPSWRRAAPTAVRGAAGSLGPSPQLRLPWLPRGASPQGRFVARFHPAPPTFERAAFSGALRLSLGTQGCRLKSAGTRTCWPFAGARRPPRGWQQ